jgi:hypothetical protein
MSSSGGGSLTTRGGYHPLQTNWKFWYVQRQFNPSPSHPSDGQSLPQQMSTSSEGQKPKKKFDSYRDRLKDMGQISTVEQFF